jgi:hypothetical protein
MEPAKRKDATTTTRKGDGVKESEMNNKSMWSNEAVKAYESGQGVVLVEKPYPHYEPVAWMNKHGAVVSNAFKQAGSIYSKYDIPLNITPEWQGLTEEEFVYFCSFVDHDTLSQIENTLKDKNELR